MPFILYASKNKIDSRYSNYEIDFNSILQGIDDYKKVLPLSGNKKIQVHYCCNVLLNNGMQLYELAKKQIAKFENYSDYEKRLISTLSSFVNNAKSCNRKISYGMVSTISKGYDAAACSAIAKEVGCDNVVSFDLPQKYVDDCGKDIALQLGYKNIVTKNADTYLQNTDLLEAENVSSGELGTGIIFTAFEKDFADNIVFTGERGDKIWDKNRPDANNNFRFDNEVFTGTSMIENRLKNGYILCPIPLYGASQWSSIDKISKSSEMEFYSIGGNYDRPIPRRILESRGIRRGLFGIEKKGAGFNYRFDNLYRIKKRMSPKSFHQFNKFYKKNKHHGYTNILKWMTFLYHNKSLYIRYIFKKIGWSFKFTISQDTAHLYSNPGAPSYLFSWGIHEMVKRYAESNIDKFLTFKN